MIEQAIGKILSYILYLKHTYNMYLHIFTSNLHEIMPLWVIMLPQNAIDDLTKIPSAWHGKPPFQYLIRGIHGTFSNETGFGIALGCPWNLKVELYF